MDIQAICLHIYPALLVIVILMGAKLSPKGEFSPDFLCPQQGKLIRGAACIAIILHHLTQQATVYGSYNMGPITLLANCGILFTSVFFFFSGYGLIISLFTKPGYLNDFLKKRLLSILIPFWIINAIGVLIGYLTGIHYNLSEVFLNISGISLVNSNGWYIIEIAFLYFFFYLFFGTFGNRKISYFLLTAATFGLIFFSYTRGHDTPGAKVSWFRGEWWFNSTFVFILGTLFAARKEKITALLQKHYRVLLPAVTLIFTAALLNADHAVKAHGYYMGSMTGDGMEHALVTLAAQTASCFFFILLMILLSMKLTLNSKPLNFLGGISTEMFLIHGFFISRVFARTKMSHFALFGAVLACSIVSGTLISPVVKLAVKLAVTPRPKKDKIKKRISIKKTAAILASAAVILCVFSFAYGRISYARNLTALSTAAVGDRVYWGRFNTGGLVTIKERMEWIVVRRDGESIWLLSEKGIAGSSYNRAHEEVSWEDCDLRALLNSAEFTSMFSDREKSVMTDVDGDLISLLTPSQVLELFKTEKDRELDITPAAEAAGTNINRMTKVNNWDMKGYRSAWWWLRGDSRESSLTAPIVTSDGIVVTDEKYVNKPGGAIRPLIRIRYETRTGED